MFGSSRVRVGQTNSRVRVECRVLAGPCPSHCIACLQCEGVLVTSETANWKVVPTFTLWLPVNLFRNLAGKCELQSSFQDAPHQSWRAPASLRHFLSSMGCWWSGHTDHNHTRRRAEGQSGDPGGLTILSPTWCSSNFTTPSWCCRSSSAPSSPPRTSSEGSI